MEYLLRMMVPVGLYRTDLALARSGSSMLAEREREKFMEFLSALEEGSGGLQLVITDSQAIDVMARWVPRRIPLTTFSIMMINQTAGGICPSSPGGGGNEHPHLKEQGAHR